MKAIRTDWRFAMGIAVACLAWSGTTSAESDDGVVEFYNGSSDLPDEIAFGEFLNLVYATRKNGKSQDLPIVAEALGIDLDDPAGTGRARSRSAFFANAHAALNREKVAAGHAVLCSGDRASKSTEVIGNAMNAVDDVEQNAKENRFLITLNSLSAEERNSFLAYLNDLKLGISYTRIDSRKQYQDEQGNLRTDFIRTDLEQRCNALEEAKTFMGVE